MGTKISTIISNKTPIDLTKSNGVFVRAYRSNKTNKNSNQLFKKLSTLRDPNFCITPFLDQWAEEGKMVKDFEFQRFIRELRSRKRDSHALQVSFLFFLIFFSWSFVLGI